MSISSVNMASAVSHSPQAQAAQSKPPVAKPAQDQVVLSEAAKAAMKAGGDSDHDGD